jgi:hypothetical protein
MRPRATTHRERIEMIQQHQAGHSFRQIAEQMGLHRDTVRSWWRVWLREGWAGLKPKDRHRPGRGPLSSFDPLVCYGALRLKCEHPHWGPDTMLLNLSRRLSLAGKALPSRSALAAYLQPYLWRIRQQRRAARRRPASGPVQLQAVHDCWQMDFKGSEAVGPCGPVAPFLVTEALTSAPLGVVVRPATRKGLTFRDVQADLRTIFARWGLPDAIRVDRDPLFVGSSRLEWPGTLLLWLVGLGVMPIVNDPYRPTQNARVERQGRTWKDDVAVGPAYPSLQAVQAASDRAQVDRLMALPSRNPACAGRPPLVAQPELSTPRRPFDPSAEVDLFDFESVELYLSDWSWVRQVDKIGYISLADQNVSVGRSYYRQAVEVVYDLEIHAFTARTLDHSASTLRQFSLDVITPGYIVGISESVC